MLIVDTMKYIWILRRKIQTFVTVINENVVSPLVTPDILCHSGSLLKVLFSPDLIVSRLSNVPDPGESLVSRLLDDLEVPYLDAWGGEIGDLVLHFNWRLTVDGLRFDGGEAETGSHQVFLKNKPNHFECHNLWSDPLKINIFQLLIYWRVFCLVTFSPSKS